MVLGRMGLSNCLAVFLRLSHDLEGITKNETWENGIVHFISPLICLRLARSSDQCSITEKF